MASNIDPTKPASGQATTQSVRDNFQASKNEIEALQAKDTAQDLEISANQADIATNKSDITDLQNTRATITYVDSENAAQDTVIGQNTTDIAQETADRIAGDQALQDQIDLLSGNPVGTVLMYAGTTAPDDYLLCDGSPIPAEYTGLIALVGANTPDLRGQFIRGWSEDAAVDPDGPRAVLSGQEDAQQPITGSWSVQNGVPAGGTGSVSRSGSYSTKDGNTGTTGSRYFWNIDSSRQCRTAPENRPVNTALTYIIKHD